MGSQTSDHQAAELLRNLRATASREILSEPRQRPSSSSSSSSLPSSSQRRTQILPPRPALPSFAAVIPSDDCSQASSSSSSSSSSCSSSSLSSGGPSQNNKTRKRQRTVSAGSVEEIPKSICAKPSLPLPSMLPSVAPLSPKLAPSMPKHKVAEIGELQHHDWSRPEDKRASPQNSKLSPPAMDASVTRGGTFLSKYHGGLGYHNYNFKNTKTASKTKQGFVGTTSKRAVRAVLQKKFSWKNFPELEDYLKEHREEYLEYSSSLNYTAEQKQYNNKLTRGLLELASEKGYVFENFTFAMIRDRIRCYYKSYVQATKKKKKLEEKKDTDTATSSTTSPSPSTATATANSFAAT